ncbi:MAG: iron donor protein CyaY [Burkholderiaceae bacterium]
MNESEFLQQVNDTLNRLETAVETQAEAFDVDVDLRREGHVLTLDFDSAGKVIVNAQTPTRELWLAARSGGYHYRWQDGQWRNTRTAAPFLAELAAILAQQVGGGSWGLS